MLQININLASKPFVNQRKFSLILAALLAVLLASSAWNISKYNVIHAYKMADSAEIAAYRARLAEMDRESLQLRQRLQRPEIAEFLEKADYLNQLIDQRTFSWTQLLNELETLTPASVQIASLHPKVEAGAIQIEMVANARTDQDAILFVGNLESSGSFFNVRPLSEDAAKTPGMAAGKQIRLVASYRK
jgi:type IV pilus assembly protein PilN